MHTSLVKYRKITYLAMLFTLNETYKTGGGFVWITSKWRLRVYEDQDTPVNCSRFQNGTHLTVLSLL